MLRSAQNCKKCNFLDNLRTITQEGNMETRRLTPFLLSSFSVLTVCNIYFVFENSQNSFSCCPPLWSMLVCKIPQFLAKNYRFRQLIILFLGTRMLESRHPEATKIHITFCSPTGAKYPFFLGSSSWTILYTFECQINVPPCC